MPQDRRVQTFFDERAHSWDDNLTPAGIARAREILAALDMARAERVLDVGCGTGVLFPLLVERLDRRAWIVAVDIAFNMVREARKRVREHKIVCLQADALCLPFPDGCFDCVLCYNTFPHFPDSHAAVHELARVAAVGGRLLIFHSKSRREINEFHKEIGGAVGGHRLPSARVIRRSAANAGLQIERIEELPDRYIFEAVRSA